MELKQPFKIYTAENNFEAIMIVEMLRANDLPAFVEEDQSSVSLWGFGTLTQFHQPNVWVEEATAQKAADLIRQFEERKQQRANPEPSSTLIQAQCEECGKTSSFPDTMDGTVQDCPHCGAFMDVGKVDFDTELDEPREDSN